jgi:hypothetical protein
MPAPVGRVHNVWPNLNTPHVVLSNKNNNYIWTKLYFPIPHLPKRDEILGGDAFVMLW